MPQASAGAVISSAAQIAAGVITNTHINASAAIAASKLAGFVRSNGQGTFDLATADGNIVIAHNLGVVPKHVMFIMQLRGALTGSEMKSYGFYDSSGQSFVRQTDGVNTNIVGGASIGWIAQDGGAGTSFTLTVDATNLTIATVKQAGGITGTIRFVWEAAGF